ncbi:TonB-dependent siderophore receptor [Caulobacter radicis]|uniref:TonB-dependent siderophore receptor n=1 Tax=Caulobacter radicis TaxID=2172650 RepID=UPI0014025345|nr:TonB-dependent receptor [Caulobacter radicis]
MSLFNQSGLSTAAVSGALLLLATAAHAQDRKFEIAAGDLRGALKAYEAATGQTVGVGGVDLSGRKSRGARGAMAADQALARILSGTNLQSCSVAGGFVVIDKSAQCPGAGSDNSVATVAPVVVAPVSHLADRNRTGTRIDADPMTLPMSVSTVSQELIARQQALTLDDAVSNVAGVSGNGKGEFSIRGFSAGAMRNGTLSADGQTNDLPIVAISRVEVVKGPEAIIAGVASRYGGVVNVITKTPMVARSAEFTATAGSRGYYDIGMDVGGALDEDKTILARLVASTQDSDTNKAGYRGASSDYVSPSLTWKIRKWGTEITAQYEYQDLRKPPQLFVYTVDSKLVDDLPIRRLGPASDGQSVKNRNANLSIEQRFTDNWSGALRYTHNEQDRNTTAGLTGVGTPYGFAWPNLVSFGSKSDAQAKVDALKLELKGKFSTGPIEHSLLLAYDNIKTDIAQGVQYTDARTINLDTGEITDRTATLGLIFGGLPTARFTGGLSPKETGYLALDQMTWNKWVVLGGWRKVNYSPNIQNRPSLGTFNESLPTLGIVYRAKPDLSLYVSASKGFEPNLGLYGIGGSPVAPENAQQVEGGVKAQFFDRRVAATASVFHIEQKNVAVADPANPDPVCAGGSVCYISASGVTSDGFEIELSGEVTSNLQVRANYSYLKKQADSPDQLGITYAPHTGNVWASYTFGQNGLGWWVSGNLQLRSKRNDAGPLYADNPGNARLDLTAGYDATKWSMIFGVKNATNARLYDTSSGYIGIATVIQPREAYATLRYKFQ